jgi:putative SOS response-associated peptidase YedK
MSTYYETLQNASAYPESFGVESPAVLGERHLWPRKNGFFIRAAAEAVDEVAPVVADDGLAESPPSRAARRRELVPAQWGLVPHWVKSASDGKLRAPKLAHAKSDTASTGTAFRDAWLNGQRCIVPMLAFYEDDFRPGKAVPTRITRVDGKPMGVAGLWARWQGPDGEVLLSYALLTVNANNHALMHRYQQPGSEKSMPAILNEGAYDAWLSARQEKAKEFMRQYPAQWLTANPLEKKADKVPKGWLE